MLAGRAGTVAKEGTRRGQGENNRTLYLLFPVRLYGARNLISNARSRVCVIFLSPRRIPFPLGATRANFGCYRQIELERGQKFRSVAEGSAC